MEHEIADIISEISFLYKRHGFTVMADKANNLNKIYQQYNTQFKTLTTRYKNEIFEFRNVDDLVRRAEAVQNAHDESHISIKKHIAKTAFLYVQLQNQKINKQYFFVVLEMKEG